MSDDFLTHYGIKGMKWGVRRKSSSSDSSGSSSSSSGQTRLKTAGKVAASVAIGGAVAAGAAYLGRNSALRQTRLADMNKNASLLTDGARWLAQASSGLNLSGMDTEVLARSYEQFVKAR